MSGSIITKDRCLLKQKTKNKKKRWGHECISSLEPENALQETCGSPVSAVAEGTVELLAVSS